MKWISLWAMYVTPTACVLPCAGRRAFSYHSPDSYVDTNIKGTLNVLNAARELGTQRVMVTSTSEVYGTAQYVPIDEHHPFQGQSPYSATKIGADRLAESFYRSFDLPVSIVRPFNTYGPRQSGRAIIPTNRLLGDATKLRTLTDWKPQYTFEQGLAETIEFLRGNLDQYKVGQYIL